MPAQILPARRSVVSIHRKNQGQCKLSRLPGNKTVQSRILPSRNLTACNSGTAPTSHDDTACPSVAAESAPNCAAYHPGQKKRIAPAVFLLRFLLGWAGWRRGGFLVLLRQSTRKNSV